MVPTICVLLNAVAIVVKFTEHSGQVVEIFAQRMDEQLLQDLRNNIGKLQNSLHELLFLWMAKLHVTFPCKMFERFTRHVGIASNRPKLSLNYHLHSVFHKHSKAKVSMFDYYLILVYA